MMAVRQGDVIERLKAGETLLRVLPRGDCASEGVKALLSGGGNVTEATYRRLTTSEPPMVAPVSPGLFPDAEPQEWGWVGE